MAVDDLFGEGMPRAYDRLLVPSVFGPFAKDLGARVAALAPTRVLELAAGTGALTRVLADVLDDAEIVATDVAPPMVAYAREALPAPHVVFEVADATDLAFAADATFDAVVCQFGVMFFPDRRAAFTEAHRVLTGAGHLVFSTWLGVEHDQVAAILNRTLRELMPADPPAFVTAVPHGYHDEATIRADVAAGGLELVDISKVRLTCRAASARDVALGFCTGTPVRTYVQARGGGAEVVDGVERALVAELGDTPLESVRHALVVTATRSDGDAGRHTDGGS